LKHFQDVKDINKIVISSGLSDNCFFEWVQPRSATCTDMQNRRNSQLLRTDAGTWQLQSDKAKKIP